VALWVAVHSFGGEEGNMSAESKRIVRKATGGGHWFPAIQRDLDATVSGAIKEAKVPKIEGRIVAAMAPHAGYLYSGKVAGYTYRAIQDNAAGTNRPETVVVLGFTHSTAFEGVALMDGDAYQTPLGETPLDKEAADVLIAASSKIAYNYTAHSRSDSRMGPEHSAGNQVPFVQAAVPGAKLVIGLIGDHDPATIEALAAALNALAKKKRILVVASTDMLHDADYDLVTKTDKATLEKVKVMDSQGVFKRWSPSSQVFCGIGPVLTVMRFAEAQGCKQGTVLHYRNSGDDFPESRGQWVVGYGAVVFAAPAK
jgi:AmmeMemoRadiSam system protein B